MPFVEAALWMEAMKDEELIKMTKLAKDAPSNPSIETEDRDPMESLRALHQKSSLGQRRGPLAEKRRAAQAKALAGD